MDRNRRKNARQVDTFFYTIEDAVKYLEECRSRGESVCVKFDNKTLYSDDVTLDSAYILITGTTKEEADELLEEFRAAKTPEEKQAVDEKRDKFEETHIYEQKKSAEEVTEYWGSTIKDAVKYLTDCRNRGESAYIVFNSNNKKTTLYSADVTMEDAYLEIFGITKEEGDSIDREMADAKTPEERDAVIKKYSELKQRHAEEIEIRKKQKEKKQLQYEISDIEKQLEELKENEAKLKGELAKKSDKLSEMEK